ncbi:hypothetical protein K6V98_05865 [Collinsella sp. AGMB00827]|uniref:PTS EIIA type-4 domain-containing protein n=1 Tax=Collinsella ureilytica TaxID=2869515 RepID=A0ABS7MLA4_9ACTN|nr:hypothetical protein [Collinsella urealyticum]MBY4797875.1 hypothetical protein [Collinsella urealyticum]
MAQIIIASHGGLAAGIVDSIRMIAGGVADGIESYGLLPGESADDFRQELEERIKASDEQFIILCDILGGSVHTTLLRLTHLPNVLIFSGVTLALALEVALTAQDIVSAERAEELIAGAREGMTVRIGGFSLVAEDEDEDF